MKWQIIPILVLVFVLFGCTGSTTTGTKMNPFVGGTTGIAVDFAPGAPPPETFDGGDSPFDVVIILENKGEYDVPAGDIRVKVKGILASDFGKTESDLIRSPEEDVVATMMNSEGDIIAGPQVYVEFTEFNHVDPLTGNTPFTILAEICYNYQTDAQAMLCVKEDNLDVKTEGKMCTVSESKIVYNSGAPVIVENFKEVPAAKDKVRFTFDVVHRGTGDVYQKDTECSRESMSTEDKIWVEVKSTIQGGSIKCSGLADGTDSTGYVKLYSQGKNTITCTQEVTTNSDYESPVNIKLVYDYESTKTASILVKHIEDY